MRKCDINNMPLLLEKMAKSFPLYLPVDGKDGSARFERWSESTVLSDKVNTVRGAKDFFFPQTENLMDFKVCGKEIELKETQRADDPFILFGVRACDVRSLDILDRVFLSEPKDSFYAARRECGIVVSLACTRFSETCFCTVFGINPAEPLGDVSCIKTEHALYMQANTEKGERLMRMIETVTEECKQGAADEQKKEIAERAKRLPLAKLSLSAFGSGKTDKLFDSDKWSELSQSCLGCGACTFVCPTCQCYDIKDFDTGSEVKRFRCWDSCMYSDFTKMSAGQPRHSQLERFRQRFMHKLVYYPENNDGIFSCVGCGRCLSSCPISMNIAKVINAFGGVADE